MFNYDLLYECIINRWTSYCLFWYTYYVVVFVFALFASVLLYKNIYKFKKMKALLKLVYFLLRGVVRRSYILISFISTYIKFVVYNVHFSSFKSLGIPIVNVTEGAELQIGKGFKMNNGSMFNRIGRNQRCFFIANNGAKIKIGDNVGISSTAFHSNLSINVGDNVRIGGNTVIYDTDFHSLDYQKRISGTERMEDVLKKPVIIEDNVFIGAHCIILKGVTVGANSIVGAGSVVSKSIPPNEIWAGNPARKIRNIQDVGH